MPRQARPGGSALPEPVPGGRDPTGSPLPFHLCRFCEHMRRFNVACTLHVVASEPFARAAGRYHRSGGGQAGGRAGQAAAKDDRTSAE